jgi:hypothetical protein
MSPIQDATKHNTTDGWKQLHKAEVSMKGGRIVCKSSAALRIDRHYRSTTVFSNAAVKESTSCDPKLFCLMYDGTTADGERATGIVALLEDFWKVDSVKVRSANAKARLLLMRFSEGDVEESQLTIPISNHSDSKQSKALVNSLLIYGTHYINNKEISVGKQALGHN